MHVAGCYHGTIGYDLIDEAGHSISIDLGLHFRPANRSIDRRPQSPPTWLWCILSRY